MAQPQPRREDDALQTQAKGQDQNKDQPDQAIRYGHVFAGQPIEPRDATAMRSFEDSVPGVQVPQGISGGFSAAVAMETTAVYNQAAGAVHPGQASDAAAVQGITVTQTAVPGGGIVTEFVAGQVVEQYSVADRPPPVEEDATKITIGEALEAIPRAGGGRSIDRANAEAIRAAEMSAHGADVTMPGGLGDQAQAAARANTQATRDDDKFKIGDILSDATAKLAGNKAAGTEDAARVVQAEKFNDAGAHARAGGVGAAVTTAARLNEDNDLGDA
ncbi:late embryogenesis abundant protein 31-like [Phragmites australis]|uniref:late embryogenesis abundant protein 31-like n=1 Tax=Phragmites australis TaxID=29695 RepID=UPI002D7A2519|nr:late embryogenesis abundant protein 31-like [Phragmites australis]